MSAHPLWALIIGFLGVLKMCFSSSAGIQRSGFQIRFPPIEQSQNLGLLCRQPVKLIFWMMAIGGASMGRKLSKEILIQGGPFFPNINVTSSI